MILNNRTSTNINLLRSKNLVRKVSDDGQQIIFNEERLNQYVDFVISLELIRNGTKAHNNALMRQCDAAEYKERGQELTETKYKYRLCPDMSKIDSDYMLKNEE